MNRPDTDEFIKLWEPRIGPAGARWFALYAWAVYLMGPILLLCFVSIFLATEFGDPITIALAALIGACGLANASILAVAPVAARRSASRVLGVKVTMSNYPPRDSVAYRNWCARNGLVPFSAAARET